MKKILTLFILGLVSCDNRNGVEFTIHNESQESFDSIQISTSDKKSTISFLDIQKGQIKKDILDMEDVSKADGDYEIEISTSKQTRTYKFGYYSNGFSLDESYNIYIDDDTIKYELKIK